jgi:hypothetical protein
MVEYERNGKGAIVLNPFIYNADDAKIAAVVKDVADDFCNKYFNYLLKAMAKNLKNRQGLGKLEKIGTIAIAAMTLLELMSRPLYAGTISSLNDIASGVTGFLMMAPLFPLLVAGLVVAMVVGIVGKQRNKTESSVTDQLHNVDIKDGALVFDIDRTLLHKEEDIETMAIQQFGYDKTRDKEKIKDFVNKYEEKQRKKVAGLLADLLSVTKVAIISGNDLKAQKSRLLDPLLQELADRGNPELAGNLVFYANGGATRVTFDAKTSRAIEENVADGVPPSTTAAIVEFMNKLAAEGELFDLYAKHIGKVLNRPVSPDEAMKYLEWTFENEMTKNKRTGMTLDYSWATGNREWKTESIQSSSDKSARPCPWVETRGTPVNQIAVKPLQSLIIIDGEKGTVVDIGNDLRNEIIDKMGESGIIDLHEFALRPAGGSSIDIGISKNRALEDFIGRNSDVKRQNVVYFGDEFGYRGNDYPILGVNGITVVSVGEVPRITAAVKAANVLDGGASPDDTWTILENVSTHYNISGAATAPPLRASVTTLNDTFVRGLPLLIGKSLRYSMNPLMERLVTTKGASDLMGKSFVAITKEIPPETWYKLHSMREMGMKGATAITMTTQESAGLRVPGRLLARLGANDNRYFDVYVGNKELVDDEGKKIGVVPFVNLVHAETRDDNGDEVRGIPVNEDVLLGLGALKLIETVAEDAGVRDFLRQNDIHLTGADILELGSSGEFANPALYNETSFGKVFGRTMVIYNPRKNAQAMPVSAGELEGIEVINHDRLTGMTRNGRVDTEQLGIKMAQRVIGDEALIGAHPDWELKIFNKDNYRNFTESFWKIVINEYLEGVKDHPQADRIENVREQVIASSLRDENLAEDPGTGKLDDLPKRVEKNLSRLGAGEVEVEGLGDPESASPQAGRIGLVNFSKDPVGRKLIHAETIGKELLYAQSERTGRIVDTGDVERRQLEMAKLVLKELDTFEGYREEYRKFKEEQAVWLDVYARGRAGRLATSGAEREQLAEAFKLLQFMYDRQAREAMRAVKSIGGGAIVTIDVTARNAGSAIDAIKHWLSFGFMGVKINIGEGVSLSETYIAQLKSATERARAAKVSVQLSQNAAPSLVNRLRQDFDVVGQNIKQVKLPQSGMSDDAVLGLIRNAAASNPSAIVLEFGVLWGEALDLDTVQTDVNKPLREVIRMPREGDKAHAFGTAMVLKMAAILVSLERAKASPEAMHERGFAEGVAFEDAAKIDAADWDAMNRRESRITLHYDDGTAREVIGMGLHTLLKVHAIMLSDEKQGRVAKEYAGTELITMALQLVNGLENGNEKEALKERIGGFSADNKQLANMELLGFLYGAMGNVLMQRYLATEKMFPANKADGKRLMAVLLLADSLGISAEEIKTLRPERPQFAGTPRTFAEMVADITAKAEKNKHWSASRAFEEMQAALNPVLNAMSRSGSLPDAFADKNRETAVWAITETLKLLPQFDDWKRKSFVKETGDLFKGISVNVVKAMEGAG